MAGGRTGAGALGVAGFLPIGISFLLAMIMLLPLGSGVAGYAMPHLVMISCFYWLSSRPLLMPYGACFLLGLFLDLWIGVPLGINVTMLLLTRLFVLSQLKHYRGKNRGVHWVVFTLMAFSLLALSWAITSVVEGRMLSVNTVFFQWLVTSFFYAPVAFVLGRLRRLML